MSYDKQKEKRLWIVPNFRYGIMPRRLIWIDLKFPFIHSITGTAIAVLGDQWKKKVILLDALRRIADGQWPSSIPETEGTLAMRQVARAAIAKAEGTK
jgi:hypothetical protein